MSTPQGPQPPHGAQQQPAEQPAWGQQQPQGGWGAPQEAQQPADEETRAVPQQGWDSPETSEVPRQGASESREASEAPVESEPAEDEREAGDLFTPRTEEKAPEQPPADESGEATTLVPTQNAQQPEPAQQAQQQVWDPA
jgi:hypothetical protein